jgi:hypothetical protein
MIRAVGAAAFAGALALAALLSLAAPAAAGTRPLTTGFADAVYFDRSPQVRGEWLDRTVAAGAGIVRLSVAWSGIARGAPPADPSDPADPAYDFALLDQIVRDASARGLDVLLTVADAPAWAEGPGRPSLADAPAGTWLPDPAAYGEFARAIASRYSGGFRPAPLAPALPRVRLYQAWNEPNLFAHLMPQWDGRRAVSPDHYRRLLDAFYRGIKSVNPDNVVVTAGTAPYGARRGEGLMRPLRFWRSLLCLRKRGLRPRPCPAPVRFDVAAHHPITGAPRSRPENRDDATIPDLKRIRWIVSRAQRSGQIEPRGRRALWVTELWWESRPPSRLGVSLRKQARYVAEGLYLIWKQGIPVAVLLQLRDSIAGEPPPALGLQAGLYFADARPKPSLTAARFPFVTERRGSRTLTAWGRSPASGSLTIERRGRGGGWRAAKRIEVGGGEVFATRVRARGPARFRATVAGETSLTWNQRR